MKRIYKNKIKPKSIIAADTTDEELEIEALIKDKASELLIFNAAEQIAYYLKLYLKYDRMDNCSYDRLANSILQDQIISDDIAFKLAVAHSKIILKDKYNINIEQDDPLVLSTNSPLNRINEKF